MKFKKNKNVNTIEYFAQCICATASCSCSACSCTCYGTHTFQDTHESPSDSQFDSRYVGQVNAEVLSYR